jgi:hypothetical protein
LPVDISGLPPVPSVPSGPAVLGEPDEAAELDIGDPVPMFPELASGGGDDAVDLHAPDVDVHPSADSSSDRADAGADGPMGADDDLRDDRLPALDADEHGDVSDATLFEGDIFARESLRLVRADRPWARTTDVGPAPAPGTLGAELEASRGGYRAQGTARGVVRRSPDGAVSEASWGGTVVALTFLDAAGTLLAATYHPDEDATDLVCWRTSGPAVVVARVGGADDGPDVDARVTGMAVAAGDRALWVVGGFGVIRYEIA